MTPFRETLDWYYRVRDSLIVVSSLLPKYEGEITSDITYVGMTSSEIKTAISNDAIELEDITISSLFFRFESEVYRNFPNSTDPIEDLLNSRFSFVGGGLLGEIHDVRKYRNWVTHGKRWDKPITISVLQAYKTLITFLNVAGLSLN
jgi:hypothetical protein